VRARLVGVHRVCKRLADGVVVEYHYAYRGGPQIWRTGASYAPGSPEYLAKLGAAAGPALTASAGSFRAILRDYLGSLEYRQLAPRTQADYRLWLDRIDAKFGSAPKAAFERPAIRPLALAWRDQWTGKQAQYGWTVLRLIVGWAYDRGLLAEHHLRGGSKVYATNRAEVIWREADLIAFGKVAPLGLTVALRTAVETGLRPGDLVRLDRSMILPTPGGRRITVRTSKRGRLASIPVTPPIGTFLDSLWRDDSGPVLLNAAGRPWTTGYLSQQVKIFARKAKLDPRLRLYDARGSACTRLLLHGATLAEIALVMGWSVRHAAAMIEVYAALDPTATDAVLARLAEARV
jgi:integrase